MSRAVIWQPCEGQPSVLLDFSHLPSGPRFLDEGRPIAAGSHAAVRAAARLLVAGDVPVHPFQFSRFIRVEGSNV